MRTTIDIQDDVLRQAKRIAAEHGQKLGEVVSDALREAFFRRSKQGQGEGPQERDRPMPVFRGRGPMPGIDLDDNAGVRDILDEESLDISEDDHSSRLDKLR